MGNPSDVWSTRPQQTWILKDLFWHIQLTTRFKFTILGKIFNIFQTWSLSSHIAKNALFLWGFDQPPIGNASDSQPDPAAAWMEYCSASVMSGLMANTPDFGIFQRWLLDMDVRSKHATKISHGSSKWMQIYSVYTGSRPKMPETRWKTQWLTMVNRNTLSR